MMREICKYFMVLLLLAVFSSPLSLGAQSGNAVTEREVQLRAELLIVEAEIKQQQEILKAKQRESVSLERDVAILNAEIAKAKLSIKAKNLTIERLGKDIGTKTEKIGVLEEKIEKSKESLAKLIRKSNESDAYSVPEILLSNKDFSEFFAEMDSFTAVQRSINVFFEDIKASKETTETEREQLAERKRQETDARKAIEGEQRTIERAEGEKKKLLSFSRSEEKAYQSVLSDREKKAAQIRTALFQLRDSAAIPFGTALQYANEAEATTGVRAAFILAILTQETNLGENVGTCNRPGDPPSKHWREIMKPSRDHAPYLRITSALGLDPEIMPLSCPWQGGWGGAMGPSQFIPSTWEIYATKVANALGKSVASPWEPKDAFTASAFYLKDLGAARGGYSAEREAALRYYAGGAWKKPANAFYGNQVMQKATNIQENMIDPLQNI